MLLSPANGATGVPYRAELTWAASPGNLYYEVYFGESPTPALLDSTTGGEAGPGLLKPGTKYYWRVVARNNTRSASSGTWSFTTQDGVPWIPQGSLVDAASFQSPISLGSWVSIFGRYLASSTRSWRPEEIVNGQLPTQLDDVSVTINGRPAAVSYISPTQVNVQVPDAYSGLDTLFRVTNAHGIAFGSGSPARFYAPSFFMYGAAGRKYIAAQHADGSMLGPVGLYAGVTSTPAKPGEVVVLYGAGFGQTNPPTPAGQVVTTPAPLATLSGMTIRIGGSVAQVQWAGIIVAGLWQINVVVPEGLPAGDAAVTADLVGWRSQDNAFIAIRQ